VPDCSKLLAMSESRRATTATSEEAESNGIGARSCLLCGGLRHRSVFNEFGVDILRCQHCGHVFSSFQADPHYKGYWGDEVTEDDHFYWSEARARMHQDFFKKFVAGRCGRLLDMGCGLGFFVKAMAPYSTWETFGCEISPAAVRFARDELGLSNVLNAQLEDVDFQLRSFDIITMWDVLDHIPNPDPLLRHSHALLRSGGVCFIRTANVVNQLFRARLKRMIRGMQADMSYLMVRDHAHHYSQVSICSLLKRNGFANIEFAHLRPIDGVSRPNIPFVRTVRNVGFAAVRAIALATGGRLNLDSLFVVARKE
jgi:2-polyprenyl-3-methyl-5-hydroxy-6-metoxy-1,4-benzoquinol methylase